MEKNYHHYSYLNTLAKKIPRFAIALILLCWLPPLFVYLFLYQGFYAPIIRLSFMCSLVITFIALLSSIILHELRGTVYVVSETGIIKKSPYKVSVIHFDRVAEFRYVHFFFFNGFGSISVPGRVIRLPFIIEHLPELIQDIQNRLNDQGKQNAYSAQNILEFREKSLVSEQGVSRISNAIPRLYQIVIIGMAESAFVAQTFWHMSIKPVLFWTLCGLIFPIAGFVVAELFLSFKSIKALRQKSPDGVFINESNVYLYVGVITAVVYMLMGIVLKSG
jgi:hypothetical protein